MVQLKLQAADDSDLPDGYFLSVRVGELQKLTTIKGNVSRSFDFPASVVGARRDGRIEIYKRVGSCSVDIDPAGQDNGAEISVQTVEAGIGDVRFRLDVLQPSGDGCMEDQEAPVDESQMELREDSDFLATDAISRAKLDSDTKDYLGKHRLLIERTLRDSLQAVLRTRPEDPGAFLGLKSKRSGALSVETYAGQIKEGYYHGAGCCTYTSGSRYDGQWVLGKRQGRGSCTYGDGSVFRGEWDDDQNHGIGECTFADGNFYRGNWCRGRLEGDGAMCFANKDEYLGQWRNGGMHGIGIFWTCANSAVYRGELANGKRDGKGLWRLEHKDGTFEEYDGEFAKDEMHGSGKYTYADGKVVEGTWFEGKHSG
eukprot:TRINITY_DN30919_c0_g1_i2.p1 TRINITY_DN30919_c0_g1~~TRINITY_DN30919_c0_g1_i2.p1  ORF type:complete len:369 (+),score=66.54 TRINITY_DN30919_c0_g1_i2:60-1166(+)